jgi:hypothetical protein
MTHVPATRSRPEPVVDDPSRQARTRKLLLAGAVAGPLYMVTGLIQALTRDGFDLSRHAWSMLTLGTHGWVQTANFVVTGLLVVAAAVGLGRATGSRWTARLLAVHGLGMVAAGVFVPDPALGFPPDAPAGAGVLSWHGLAHFVAGGIGFACFVAACFVLARHLTRTGSRSWAVFSRVTGVLFLAAFAGIASGSTGPTTLAFVAAVLLSFVWLGSVCVRVAGRP